MRRVNRGIKHIGGWAFWLGFWTVMLRRNLRRARRQHETIVAG